MIYGYTVETTKTTGLIHLFLILGGLGSTFIFYVRPFLSDVTIPTWLCYFRVQHLPFRECRDSSGDITSEGGERKKRLLKQKEQDKRTNDSIKHPLLVVLQR